MQQLSRYSILILLELNALKGFFFLPAQSSLTSLGPGLIVSTLVSSIPSRYSAHNVHQPLFFNFFPGCLRDIFARWLLRVKVTAGEHTRTQLIKIIRQKNKCLNDNSLLFNDICLCVATILSGEQLGGDLWFTYPVPGERMPSISQTYLTGELV